MPEIAPEDLASFSALHDELGKTAVLSDAFRDYLLQMGLAIAHEASLGTPELPELHQEFCSRRFSDKTTVKLGASCMEELVGKLSTSKQASGFGEFLHKRFPEEGRGFGMLITGTYDDVVAFRDWLWREIDEHPDAFAQMVGLGEWSN